MPETNDSFLGTGWAFPPSFDKEAGGVRMASDEEDVIQSIKILLGTTPGERVMRPRFGTNMEKLLFQPLDSTLQAYMEDLIRDALTYHEPRVTLNKLTLIPKVTEGLVEISVDFTIRSTNRSGNLVYPYYLTEGDTE